MTTIKVLISIQAYQKLRYWVNMAKGEVSGLGTVSEIRSLNGNLSHYLIDDIFLLKQESGSADTHLDDQFIGRFLTDMVNKKQDVSKIKLWWHSHGGFKTFWSATDESCIANLANSSYMISIVTNKEHQLLTRIDIYSPFHVTVDNVTTDLDYSSDPELEEFCKNEFKEKVTERQAVLPVLTYMDIPEVDNRYDIDTEMERLENLVSDGKMSVDEYERRVHELYLLEETEYA